MTLMIKQLRVTIAADRSDTRDFRDAALRHFDRRGAVEESTLTYHGVSELAEDEFIGPGMVGHRYTVLADCD